MIHSTYRQSIGNVVREGEAAWDKSLLTHLLQIENVWAVLITSGKGELLHVQQRQELPTNCPELLDLIAGVVRHAGDRLQAGQLNYTVFMFSGVVVVGKHAESGASAFALAAPEANLGQLLAHIRKVPVSSGASLGEQS